MVLPFSLRNVEEYAKAEGYSFVPLKVPFEDTHATEFYFPSVLWAVSNQFVLCQNKK